MLDDFTGRKGTAIVTGGSGGIGAAVCRRLAQAGSAVTFTYRSRRAAAERLLSELSGGPALVSAHQVDLTDPAATERFVEAVAEESGGVHTVVHAAGPFVPQTYLSQVTPAMMLAQLTEDPAAFFTVVHAALPALRESRGSVVAVTTAATRRHPARDGLSTGTKGAVEAIARAFAVEEGRYGVRVNCVGPGMLTDGMSAVLMGSGQLDEHALEVTMRNIPLRMFGDSTDIAEAVCFLASGRARFITGQKLDVDGGYTA
jgi:NAD(P)-dependent dehydrogenase (short-subunit alcohol dehydrogenase family)